MKNCKEERDTGSVPVRPEPLSKWRAHDALGQQDTSSEPSSPAQGWAWQAGKCVSPLLGPWLCREGALFPRPQAAIPAGLLARLARGWSLGPWMWGGSPPFPR